MAVGRFEREGKVFGSENYIVYVVVPGAIVFKFPVFIVRVLFPILSGNVQG